MLRSRTGWVVGNFKCDLYEKGLMYKISLKNKGKKRLRLKIGFPKTVMMRWAQEIKRENLDLLLNK